MACAPVLGDLEVVLFEDKCHHAKGGQREKARASQVAPDVDARVRTCPSQWSVMPMTTLCQPEANRTSVRTWKGFMCDAGSFLYSSLPGGG